MNSFVADALAARQKEIEAILDAAILDDAVPGIAGTGTSAAATPGAVGAVLVETAAGPKQFVHAAGHLFDDRSRDSDEGARITPHTVFDLASLTKVLCTTLLVADAVAAKKISLDECPFPSWPDVTVAQLLAHEAGFEPHREYFRAFTDGGDCGLRTTRNEIVAAVLATPLEAAPGTRTRYSDLGFIALGAFLEQRLGAPLDKLFTEVARKTYGETGLCFVSLPDEGVHASGSLVAPTERCDWRGRTVQGQVHDDNAFAMGGVAGHAGLFGTAADVLAAGRFWLRALTDDNASLALVTRAFTKGTGANWGGARPLGFDRPTKNGTTGESLSPDAIGHLGFTGTSLWLDPADTGAVFVLLTNRVHPSRDREGIRALRIAFHEAARAFVDAARGATS